MRNDPGSMRYSWFGRSETAMFCGFFLGLTVSVIAIFFS